MHDIKKWMAASGFLFVLFIGTASVHVWRYFNFSDIARLDNVSSQAHVDSIAESSSYNFHDGYLWHGSKKLTNKNIFELTGLDPNYRDGGFNEWLRYESDNKLFVYMRWMGGCGGCANVNYYFEIDRNSDAVKLVKDDELTKLTFGVISPDKKKVVYVSVVNGNEILYVYNLITKTNKLMLEVPANASVMMCGDGCSLHPSYVYWLDNDNVAILPGIKTEKSWGAASYTYDTKAGSLNTSGD